MAMLVQISTSNSGLLKSNSNILVLSVVRASQQII